MENSHILYQIDCPPDWQSLNDFDSHRPLLWFVIDKMMPREIVEFGCGFGSTPLLEKWAELGGLLMSYETNKEWADKFPGTHHISNYSDLMMLFVDLIFLDCAPAEKRKELLKEFDAEVWVIHDTEEGAEYVYGLKEVLSTFKYRIDYKPEKAPHTTAVSNSIDITKWITDPSSM